MSEGYLEIGTLTGAVEMDDRVSRTLDLVTEKVKEFADHTLGSFKGVALAGGLVTTTLVGIAATITGLAVKGSEIQDVTEGFERMSGSMQNAEQIMRAMQAGTAGVISNLTLMRDANRLMGAGVEANAKDFQDLTTAAHVLANQGYGSLESVLGRLNNAMIAGNTYRLKGLGIVVDMAKAEREYARSLGVAASELDREAKQQAVRGALLDALRAKTAAAGEIQLSFAERFEAGITAIKNWSAELARLTAISPNVNRALDAIGKAIQEAFGGDGKSLMETIISLVNQFADAVATIGPIIIKTFGVIKDTVVGFFNVVKADWNALPDWAKTSAKYLAEVSLAAWALDKALRSVLQNKEKACGEGTSGVTSLLTKTAGGLLPKILGGGKGGDPCNPCPEGVKLPNIPSPTAPGGGGGGGFGSGIAAGFDKIVKAAYGIGPAITAGRLALNGWVAGAEGAAVGSGALGAGVAAAAVPLATLMTTLWAGTKVWDVFTTAQENSRFAAERHEQEMQQYPTLVANLARQNQIMGTSFEPTEEGLKQATAAMIEWNKKAAEQPKVLSGAELIAKQYQATIDAQVSSLTALSHTGNEVMYVFRSLGEEQLNNRKVQDEMIKRIHAAHEAQEVLGDDVEQYIRRLDKQRAAETEAAAQQVIRGNQTVQQVNQLKELGYQQDQIAQKLGISNEEVKENTGNLLDRIAALQKEHLSEEAINTILGVTNEQRARATDIVKQQEAAQDALTKSVDDYNVAISHGGLGAANKARQDERDAQLRDLRRQKDWTQEKEDAQIESWKRLDQVREMQEEESTGKSRANRKKDMDEAQNTYDIMLRNAKDFHAGDIQAAREDLRTKAEAYWHFTGEMTEAEKKATEVAQQEAAARAAATAKEAEEFDNHWKNMTITMDREQAKQLATRAHTGDMWNQYFGALGEAALKMFHQQDLAQETSAYKTKDQLREMANIAKEAFEQMKASGVYTAEALESQWKKYADLMKQLGEDVTGIARGMDPFAGQRRTVEQAERSAQAQRGQPLSFTKHDSSGKGMPMSVNFAPGSMVLNYPLINDPRAKDQFKQYVASIFEESLSAKGVRLTGSNR